MSSASRRDFLKGSLVLGATALAGRFPVSTLAAAPTKANIKFGLVTYTWGQDLDLPTLLDYLAKAKMLGVELRTGHKHGVEPSLSPQERADVKKRFADSPVAFIGMGSAQDYHDPDPKKVAESIERTKAFIKLSHDLGGSGVKVRPNALPKGVPVEKTCEQIGKALNVVGAFAADHGQQIRLEIHGGCAHIPVIKQIIDVANHPNVALCWNSNVSDLQDGGLQHNFDLVRSRLGYTTHVRQLDSTDYPFQKLLGMFVKSGYNGWWLLEAGGKKPPADRVAALTKQRMMFDEWYTKAQAGG